MWNEIEEEKLQEQLKGVRYEQWLKEREEKKLEIERQWRPHLKSPNVPKTPKSTPSDGSESPQAGTPQSPSPLLTSLLKSSQAQSSTARSAPTITNLLTGSSSSSSNSPSHIASSTIIINASISGAGALINHSASVPIPASQSAPTLITLLDKKPSLSVQDDKQQMMMSISVPELTSGKDEEVKDDEAAILADFNELIAMNDEDLEDINSIIMNPGILEDKIEEDEQIKDVDDSSQATSTDDYDKLKIKQLVEDFAGVPDVVQSPAPQEELPEQLVIPNEEPETAQVPSEAETSSPTSVEMIAPTESNDSKIESSANDDKVMIISDESSNATDEKKDDKPDEESKSSTVEEVKDVGEDLKETRAFKGIQEGDDNSASSVKEVKETTAIYQVDDSSEDGMFEDAKEHHEEPSKATKKAEVLEVKEPAKIEEAKEAKKVDDPARSDSDDEVLEMKASRSTGRKKADSLKTETPSSSTRSRDHSENDDNRDATPIRTRSRHSSTFTSVDTKPTFNFSKEQDHSMWKARWEDCLKELQKLKDYSSIVDNKLFSDDFYKTIILCPMNMKIIQRNIENHVLTLAGDVKRDFAIMCNNIIMLNKKGPKFNDTVHQFMKDGMGVIDNILEVEDAYKSYRKQIKKKN